jgi:hypothetical protein
LGTRSHRGCAAQVGDRAPPRTAHRLSDISPENDGSPKLEFGSAFGSAFVQNDGRPLG